MAQIDRVMEIGVDARKRLIRGVDKAANAVKQTLGPYGFNALIEKGLRVTNDGVTVLGEIILKDEIENLGVRKLKEIASKTNDQAGDGTTTAVTLGQAIIHELDRYLPADSNTIKAKRPAAQLIRQIEKERAEVVERLTAMAVPVTTVEQLIEVARVAVEDESMAELIGTTQWYLGPDGVLFAEEVNERESSVELSPGVRIDNGFGTSLLMNNHEKELLEVKDVKIIMTNHILSGLAPLLDVLKAIVDGGCSDIVIIARGFTPECVQLCLQNHQNNVRIYPVNAPYVDQVQVMKDLEAVCGGKFINDEEMSITEIKLEHVGDASKVISKRFSSVVAGRDDAPAKERIDVRLAELQQKLDGTSISDFERKNIQSRMAQLKNGFGTIKVGATSDSERKYLKDKVDDAVNAVRSALQEGTVPGAGKALKEISENLPVDYLLKTALLAPYQQIMANAGEEFDVPSWVRDSVKVVRVSLEQACSVAATLVTVAIVIANENPKPRLVEEVKSA